MQVNLIKVSLRCSKQVHTSAGEAWKAIGVGAEAAPSSPETWREEQDELFEELRQQLLKFFNGGE